MFGHDCYNFQFFVMYHIIFASAVAKYYKPECNPPADDVGT